MHPINETDIDWAEREHGTAKFRRKQLSEPTEGGKLGCSLYEIPAGNESWPYHYHTANEEALYVLSGTGTLRLDGEMHSLEEGDYATFPATERGGHKVINDSEAPLRYLMISTMIDPDVTVYPDSGKFGVYVGSPPGGRDERSLEGYYNIEDEVDYWEGE